MNRNASDADFILHQIKPYRPNDQVYFINEDGEREGPYLVESIAQQGKCTLVEQDGVTPVRSYAVSCKSLIPK